MSYPGRDYCINHCLLPQVGDELLEINGNNTEGMLHLDAMDIIKHGGSVVKLIVRREEPFIGCECNVRVWYTKCIFVYFGLQ